MKIESSITKWRKEAEEEAKKRAEEREKYSKLEPSLSKAPSTKNMEKRIEWFREQNEKYPGYSLRQLRKGLTRAGERMDNEIRELEAGLTPEQRKLREKIVGYKGIASKIRKYQSQHHFRTEKEMDNYITEENKKLKSVMEELVKHSEKEVRQVLREAEWEYPLEIGFYYRQYKKHKVVPLMNAAILE